MDTIRAIDKIESGEAMRQWKERSATSSLEVESEVAVEANAMGPPAGNGVGLFLEQFLPLPLLMAMTDTLFINAQGLSSREEE